MLDFWEITSVFITDLYSMIGFFLMPFLWIFIPLILLIVAKDLWLKYSRQRSIQKMEWILLEVRPPRDIQKTPYAMEQFFTGLHGIWSLPTFWEKNFQGYTQRWYSLEIVGQSGDVRFLIRTHALYRDLVEANVYAQYPESEISQVDDYVSSVPADIPNEEYNVWGSEFVLLKEDAYPIRTYVDFEKDAKTEEQRIDPLASLLEIMNKLKDGEQFWIQTLIRPVGSSWKEEGEKIRDKLVGRVEVKKESMIKKEISAWGQTGLGVANQLLTGQSSEMSVAEEKKKQETPFLWSTTKGEQDVVSAIERNISKLGFETIIRFVYVARRDVYRIVHVLAVIGSYRQFNTLNLNGFKPNTAVTTSVDYQIKFKKSREEYRRKRIIEDYRKRHFVQQSAIIKYLKPLFFERLPILRWFFIRSKPFVFNIEELATIYHYPAITVKSPLVPKVDSKKSEPPAGLPTG